MEDISKAIAEAAAMGDRKAELEGADAGEGSFLGSTASAFGEYFLGAQPTPGASSYRIDHPVSGFGSEVIPAVAGAMGALKVRSALPNYNAGIESFAERGANKLTQGGREAVATMLPVEAVRIAGTLAANPDQIGETVKESLFNLGLEGAGGALFSALKAGGRVAEYEPLPSVGEDLRNPPQLSLRDLKKQFAEGKILPDQQTSFLGKMADLEASVAAEEVGKRNLELTLDNGYNAKELSRLFKDTSSPAGNIKKMRLIKSGTDFQDEAQRLRVAEASGLKDNWDAAQLPRYVAFGSDQWAKKVSDDLLVRSGMTAVDPKTLMAKESSGMYTMARKITGDVAKPSATDEWVVWRTDEPGRFVPEVAEFSDKLAARMAYLRQDNLKLDPTAPASIMDSTRTLVSQTPIRNFLDADAEYGNIKKAADKIAAKLGYEPGEIGSSFAATRGKAIVEQYLTPKLYQFTASPMAKYIIGHADRAFAQSKFITDKIINGEATDEAAIKFARIFGDSDRKGTYLGTRSVKEIVNSLSEDDLNSIRDVADLVAGSDDAAKTIAELRQSGQISETLYRGLTDLDTLDGKIVGDLVNHQKAAERIDLNPLKGHLMLSRVWDGDYRAPILNQSGEFVYVAAGATPEAADNIAKALIKESGQAGLRHVPAERFDVQQSTELAGKIATRSRDFGVLSAANKKLRTNPAQFRERTGVGGYKTKFSKKELTDRLTSHVSERYNYMARLSVDTALEKELAQLDNSDPKTFAAVQDRLRQMSGKPGPISQSINLAADKLLKPVLGRNSATKLSSFVNEFFYHNQLGMGNALFPAMNAITFVQTVLPEAAFVMNAADNRVTRDYYDVFLAGGKDLKPRGSVGSLSPVKLMIKSFQKMANSEADTAYGGMLKRARDEGVIDPQLLQEFIGKSSEMSTKVSDVMSGDEPLINLMRTWSSFLPSKSERFARGQAFTNGFLLGQDVMGLEGEPLYQFARKFTERTMYNYGTADRATLMTGPLGRTFGLFKNWQTHYIHSMLQYAGEGVKYGNWAPLMYQMAGTGALGGAAALPIYGAADAFSRVASDQSLMEQIYENFGGSKPDGSTGTFSDAIFMGLPMFLGVSLSGNVAAPGHDPSRDAAQLMSFPQWDRMKALGGALGDSIEHWSATGQHPISSTAIRDQFISALAPKVIARSAQIVGQEALRSLNTGNVILEGMSPAERLMYGTGINPRRVGLAYEAADELWKNKDRKQKVTSSYGRAWAEAQMGGDWEKLEQLRAEAQMLGLDISSITKSANSFKEKQTTSHIERTFSPKSRQNLRELGLPGF